MGKKVVHVEFPSQDVDRAETFWEGIGGWSIESAGMPGLDEEESQSARWIWLFPNLSISLLPDYMIAMVLFPDEPGRTKEHYDYFFHPSTRAAAFFEDRASDVYRFWHQVNGEDIRIVESVQRGLQNRAYRGGRMCFRFEDTIHRFQNHVIEKMTSRARVHE